MDLTITCPTINNKIHLILAEDCFFNAVFLTVGRVAAYFVPNSFLLKIKLSDTFEAYVFTVLCKNHSDYLLVLEALLVLQNLGALFSEDIIDFHSNQRFDSDAWKDDPDNLSPLEPVTSGKKRDISNVPKNIYCKNPLPFSRAVPIFDGRDSFVTSPAQLNQISSCTYPLYKNSEEDIPTGCIVCIGYTAHTWQSSASYKAPPLSLSLGLQFVVVLALPPTYDEPAPPKCVSLRPFPKPIYNTPTRTKDFLGPPHRKSSHSKLSSDNVAGSSHIPRHGNVDSNNDSPYLNGGGLKGGFEYHEDVMMLKLNHKGR
ncbi:hypothetical protein C8J55DRAFT_566831 [Lentinula edodes]|uniref:Uncharacterized protein n=1 Tax=Lentinula lateritia TaxID=40482 RepID=A0A9W8ZRI2_9AGAR|nr:hypothetical protein C8J55DRAFT_566831 [Lentinula edodes]